MRVDGDGRRKGLAREEGGRGGRRVDREEERVLKKEWRSSTRGERGCDEGGGKSGRK